MIDRCDSGVQGNLLESEPFYASAHMVAMNTLPVGRLAEWLEELLNMSVRLFVI